VNDGPGKRRGESAPCAEQEQATDYAGSSRRRDRSVTARAGDFFIPHLCIHASASPVAAFQTPALLLRPARAYLPPRSVADSALRHAFGRRGLRLLAASLLALRPDDGGPSTISSLLTSPTHSSQMKACAPAMSFFTWSSDRPQKEHWFTGGVVPTNPA